MGKCKFCGNSAGFLRHSHEECELKNRAKKREYEASKQLIISEIEGACFYSGNNFSLLEKKINEIAESNNILDIKNLIVSGWERAVDRAFDAGVLTEKEETNFVNLIKHFSISKTQLDHNEAFKKIVKGAVLRDVMNGIIPEGMNIDGNLPFNLQKTEKIIWVFNGVDYYEQVKKTQYLGGSQGFSIRIAKGVYYRTSSFKGERVETHETIHADTGLLGITNKHIYFSGGQKSFRIRYDKIVSFKPYSDGIGLQRDAITAKPQSFITEDGWFAYNLITSAAQL